MTISYLQSAQISIVHVQLFLLHSVDIAARHSYTVNAHARILVANSTIQPQVKNAALNHSHSLPNANSNNMDSSSHGLHQNKNRQVTSKQVTQMDLRQATLCISMDPQSLLSRQTRLVNIKSRILRGLPLPKCM